MDVDDILNFSIFFPVTQILLFYQKLIPGQYVLLTFKVDDYKQMTTIHSH